MRKKINAKTFGKRLVKWQKDAENTIVEVMTQQGIKAISLLDNGNDSNSVDSVHICITDENDFVAEKQVGVMLVDGKRLVFIPENEISLKKVDEISEKGDIFSPKVWEDLNINFDNEYILDEIYSPTDSLMSAASTIDEIIERCMNGTPLIDGGMVKIF